MLTLQTARQVAGVHHRESLKRGFMAADAEGSGFITRREFKLALE